MSNNGNDSAERHDYILRVWELHGVATAPIQYPLARMTKCDIDTLKATIFTVASRSGAFLTLTGEDGVFTGILGTNIARFTITLVGKE